MLILARNRPRSTDDAKRCGERGQSLLIFALFVVPAFLAVGVATVDVGLWQGERRGAQKDADLSALAGAYGLLTNPQDANAVQAKAQQYQQINDEAGNAAIIGNVQVDNSCFHTTWLDSVTLNVSHASRTFFGNAFGIKIAPDIGAHARACMGSPDTATGLMPIGVQVTGFNSDCFQPDPANPSGPEIPVFGQYCELAFGAGTQTSGEGGLLRLFDDGSLNCSAPNTGGGQTTQNELSSGGADTTCAVAPPGTTSADCVSGVNYCVWPKTQAGGTNPIQQSIQTLLSTEGQCDSLFGNHDGIDDWLEVVQATNGDPNPAPGTTTFARRACTSPRLVSLIIIQSFSEQGNGPAPILAFATFFIQGCVNSGTVYRTCDIQGGGSGQTSLYGFFMNILNVGSLGPPNNYGQRAIALVE